MKIKEYQEKSTRTLNKNLSREQSILNMVLGISGESGEVADIVKKHFYQGHELNKEHLKEELGDVMFYICNLCNLLDMDMEEVLQINHDKLLNRYPDGFNSERSVNRER